MLTWSHAMIDCQPRQVRKEATVTIDTCAVDRLSQHFILSYTYTNTNYSVFTLYSTANLTLSYLAIAIAIS